jgi:geranylgeranyl reductase family protein
MAIHTINTGVIIIGAGPAGAGVSIYLTKAGIPHVILEKDRFPRDKVCGDACSGKTVHVLRKANPGWLEEIFREPDDFLQSHGLVFVAPNGKSINIPFNPDRLPGQQAPGFTTPRLIFDNFLFSKLASPYAAIYQEASVTEIKRGQDTVCVAFIHNNEEYEVTAPLIVGADGDKSRVRKAFLNSNNNEKSACIGLRAYYTGVTQMHPENFIELHFLKELLPGYFWIFPLPGGRVNVGVGVLSETVRKKKINLREQMLHAIKSNPAISGRFAHATLVSRIEGWGLPMYTKKQRVSGDRFLLTGDAACLIDPFTGEGIGNALLSGMLAANAIEKSVEAGDYSSGFLKEQYDDVLYRQTGDEFRISSTVQRLCNYPWLMNGVVSKIGKSPTFNKVISAMFIDMDLRKQLRNPSFYARILLNS